MSELKPCPFCGGEAAYTQILGNYERPHEVYCYTCDGGITEGRSKDGVIHNWNTRPIEDALRKRIAELESAQRWIPVSERLPEPYTRVLACIKSGYMEVDYMYSEPIVDVGIADFNSLDNVTHWMPLPKLPEVQE